MLGAAGGKRSATPVGAAGASGKKSSSISLSGLVTTTTPGKSPSSSLINDSKYKKHHSASAIPEDHKKLFLENNVYRQAAAAAAADMATAEAAGEETLATSAGSWLTEIGETYFVCQDESSNCLLHFELAGGADEGEFPHVGQPIVEDPADVGLHVSGDPIVFGNVLLEIQGQKVSGYTAADVARWFKHCLQSKSPVVVRSVPKGRTRKFKINSTSTMFTQTGGLSKGT